MQWNLCERQSQYLNLINLMQLLFHTPRSNYSALCSNLRVKLSPARSPRINHIQCPDRLAHLACPVKRCFIFDLPAGRGGKKSRRLLAYGKRKISDFLRGSWLFLRHRRERERAQSVGADATSPSHIYTGCFPALCWSSQPGSPADGEELISYWIDLSDREHRFSFSLLCTELCFEQKNSMLLLLRASSLRKRVHKSGGVYYRFTWETYVHAWNDHDYWLLRGRSA